MDGMTTDTTTHKNIPGALCAIMGEMPTLEKTMKNKHGSYNYASVDDFLNAVRPLCAKHGIVIRQDEEESTVSNDWLHVKFRYTVFHASGDAMDGGIRSIAVNAKMGSQAYGSAQSYSLKQYLRSLLMIATGDQAEEEGVMQPAQLAPKNSRDPKWKGPLPKGRLWKAIQAHMKLCEQAETLDLLNDIGSMIAVPADEVGPDWDGPDLTYNDVHEQCKHDQPAYLTGEGAPELFIPFNQVMDAALDRLGANGGDI